MATKTELYCVMCHRSRKEESNVMSLNLTEEQLAEFRETGLLVIEDVFSPVEIEATRQGFHSHLRKLGIDHDAVLSGLASAPEIRIKSPVSRIFYPRWKLIDVHLNPKLIRLAQDLLVQTYGSDKDPNFQHPFGPFTDIRAYIDRVCYRVPDSIRKEGGLGLHLDRNPVDPYLEKGPGLTKWRPIQSLVCLTDHFHGESGGLRVVPGFHKQIDDYFRGHQASVPDAATAGNGGEFCRLTGIKYTELQRRCRPVIAPAGSVIFWDNRLPHATAASLSGYDTREVIYTGFLPDTKNNETYVAGQLVALENNKPPPAYAERDGEPGNEAGDRDFDISTLNGLQRRLLGMND